MSDRLCYLDMQGYYLSQEAKELRKEQLKEDQVVVSQSEFLNLDFKQLEDKISIYLAGAITELKSPDDNYRAKLIPELKQIFRKCIIIDPLYDASWVKDVGYISDVSNETIVTNSLKVAARSNIVIAQVSSSINSPGTWFEIFIYLLNYHKGKQLYIVADKGYNIFLQFYQNMRSDFYVFGCFNKLIDYLIVEFQEPPEPIDDPSLDYFTKSIWDFCNQKTYANIVEENSYIGTTEIYAGHPQELMGKIKTRRMCYESKV